MLIGTTPSYSWTLPVDSSNISTLKITYTQNNESVLVKRKDECDLTGKKLSVTLKQEETFLFQERLNGKKKGIGVVQVRALTNDGQVIGTVPRSFGIVNCNDNEVLKNDSD